VGADVIEITFPWPPSVNTYWRVVNGRPIISEKGRMYRKAVMAIILKEQIELIEGPIRVEIDAYRPDNRKRDLDNILKALLDGMAKGLVYEDDSQIKDLSIKWAPEIGGMVKVRIFKMEWQ
jgi:crossover junction endodeoxyribonuclease RusA